MFLLTIFALLVLLCVKFVLHLLQQPHVPSASDLPMVRLESALNISLLIQMKQDVMNVLPLAKLAKLITISMFVPADTITRR